MKLVSSLVCACALAVSLAARFAEAFVPPLGGRAGLIQAHSLPASTSPAAASRYVLNQCEIR